MFLQQRFAEDKFCVHRIDDRHRRGSMHMRSGRSRLSCDRVPDPDIVLAVACFSFSFAFV